MARISVVRTAMVSNMIVGAANISNYSMLWGCPVSPLGRSEQGHELLAEGRPELFDAANRRRVAVNERDVVADADGSQLHTGPPFDVLDDDLQVGLEILVAVGRERRFIHRRAVGDDDEDAAGLAAGEQAAVRPDQRLAVDVLFEHLVVQKES